MAKCIECNKECEQTFYQKCLECYLRIQDEVRKATKEELKYFEACFDDFD